MNTPENPWHARLEEWERSATETLAAPPRNPPCAGCLNWRPRPILLMGKCRAVKMCDSEQMMADFSCYRPREKATR